MAGVNGTAKEAGVPCPLSSKTLPSGEKQIVIDADFRQIADGVMFTKN